MEIKRISGRFTKRIGQRLTMITCLTREEWLEARKPYLGGSDAAAVLCMDPYKSNTELMEEKAGIREPGDLSGNPYVQYGLEAEEYLRELFRLDFPQYSVAYDPRTILINDRYPWAHASLDGLLREKTTGRLGVLEIKTVNVTSCRQRELWDGRIPLTCLAQVLHYMMVLEAEFAIVKVQLKYENDQDLTLETKHFRVEREDLEEDIRLLEKAERKFMEKLTELKKRTEDAGKAHQEAGEATGSPGTAAGHKICGGGSRAAQRAPEPHWTFDGVEEL